MNVTVLVAVIAATVTGIGWFVTHVLALRAETEKQRLASHLSIVETQLAELYGPLAFLVLEGKSSLGDLESNLGRRAIFRDDDPWSADELATWLYWVDNDFMPRNLKIQTLLSSHTHLIVGETMPPSYLGFMEHYNSWRTVHQRWKDEGIEYCWHSRTDWPRDFDKDVADTFDALKKEHSRLVGLTR
ncbi:hypothetical protein [Nocardia sp. NPDC059239]|uniref:hypothetical protein n=1 Tax=unclassified Nocardia TaxID=2637762 RepID=UPI00368C26F4